MRERDVPPLGEILLADQAVSAKQLDAALRQQVVFGGRLGTNLLELGYADHDQLALALAKLHGIPAALMRHINGADSRARTMLSARVCVEQTAFPLAFATAGGRRLVVCVRDPQVAAPGGELEKAAHMPIVAAACPERTLYRMLAHYCGAPLPARMSTPAAEPTELLPPGASGKFETISSRGRVSVSMPPMPSMPELSLVELDHSAALRDPSQLATGAAPLSLTELAESLREKRASEVPAPAPSDEAPPEQIDEQPTAPVVRRRRAASSLSEALLMATSEERIKAVLSEPVPLGPPPLDLAGALEQIKVASERSIVSDAVIAYLKSRFDAGLILVVRDDIAFGYRGFGGHFDDASVESILVPLGATSPFKVAHEGRRRYLGAGGGDERSLFGRFLRLFPLAGRPELCVIEPIEVRDRIVCLLYAHSTSAGALDDDAFDDLGHLADGVGVAFLRLIRAQRAD